MVECGGLEIREVVLPSDTNQRLTAHSTTLKWGVLGGFGSVLCNRMCNSKNFVQQDFCGNFPDKSRRFSRRVIALPGLPRHENSKSLGDRPVGIQPLPALFFVGKDLPVLRVGRSGQ